MLQPFKMRISGMGEGHRLFLLEILRKRGYAPIAPDDQFDIFSASYLFGYGRGYLKKIDGPDEDYFAAHKNTEMALENIINLPIMEKGQ